MLKTCQGDYSDCNIHDFQHYFLSTLMVLKLTPTKNRIFLVNDQSGSGRIMGTYLSKEWNWVSHSVDWDGWWHVLVPITHATIGFNTVNGAVLWSPSLQKNLKKSLKWAGLSPLTFFGQQFMTAEEISSQHILGRAFPDIYKTKSPPIRMSLKDALEARRAATITENYFVYEGTSNTIFFKKTHIGTQSSQGVVKLHKAAAVFSRLLVEKEGISKENIKVA